VEPDVLFSALLKWLPRPVATSGLAQRSLAGAGEMEPETPLPRADDDWARLPALPGIDVAAGRRYLGGKLAFYLQMLKKFRDDHAASFVATFDMAFVAEDWETAVRLAHNLKGLSGSVGAKALAEIAGRLEHATMDRQRAKVQKLATEIGQELAVVVASLSCLDAIDPGGPAKALPVDAGMTREVFQRFEHLLRAGDTAATSCVEEFNLVTSDLASAKDAATQIGAAVARYDFGGALKQLQALAASHNIPLETAKLNPLR
jgi:HPt (histidine-containing phosphotransfer) domain-containing protein